jgi:hypothetical protein
MHPAGVPEAHVMPSTYLSLHYHLVFSTKDRAPLIEPSWQNRLHEYLGGTVEGLKGFFSPNGGGNYIANQEEHHRKKTFREELVKMLDKAGVEYDPRYLD